MAPASQILTVAQMRAAEQALIDGGETIESLMERAGTGAAEWVWRVAAGRPVTVLCGPGNNGGDGYVIARELARRGVAVTVVAPLEPRTPAAIAARASWGGAAAPRGHGGVLVDGLFGSGLARPLAPELAALLAEEAQRHAIRVALDVPSGIDGDSGAALNDALPSCDLTLALGAWKPAHWLMPAMTAMGERRLVPIGVGPTKDAARLLQRPHFAAPAADAHKYSRGLVLIVGGPMAGAALLASEGAMRAGAGCVRLAARGLHPAAPPDLVLKPQPLPELLGDGRTGAVLVGPGLGRDEAACESLRAVLAAGRASVIDADALALLDPAALERFSAPLILTPHGGEMAQLLESFGIAAGDRLTCARQLAQAARAVVVAKGPDTAIAAPDGRLVLAPSPTSWLSVAGSGDVLAGIVASRLAAGSEAFAAACEGVWLHGEAARLLGPAFTAWELARAVTPAYAAAL
ncbi:MAG TPA: NAD(P)H-hydrate dehydratase [Croceibacterium sp.]|nr:NAD(P)H-hydrate dehydratase [Croceibacterium sp.]